MTNLQVNIKKLIDLTVKIYLFPLFLVGMLLRKYDIYKELSKK